MREQKARVDHVVLVARVDVGGVADPVLEVFDPGVGRVLAGKPERHVVDVDADHGAMCSHQVREREGHVTAATPEVEDAHPFAHARGSEQRRGGRRQRSTQHRQPRLPLLAATDHVAGHERTLAGAFDRERGEPSSW